jgi:hypothetical protein
MNRHLIAGLAAVTLATSFAGAASAQQRWDPIQNRIERLDTRIDRGVRQGDLTRREAVNLRRDLDALVRLEGQYTYSGRGLDYRERADLDRRFDILQQRIRYERRDPEQRGDRRGDRYDDRYDGRYDNRRY